MEVGQGPSWGCSAKEKKYYFICFIILSGVRLSPLGTAATTGLLYQPLTIDDGDCGAIGGTKIGRGNRSSESTRYCGHYWQIVPDPDDR
jgi:hypothetical protein